MDLGGMNRGGRNAWRWDDLMEVGGRKDCSRNE
jgi:hypothetical protein